MSILAVGIMTNASAESINKTWTGIAIKGYDPVAYFTKGQAVKGSADINYQWNDSKWYFSTEEDKKMFMDHPEKYAPQYGGFCAFGVSKNAKADIDPNAWTVDHDKLYLNYSMDVQKAWLSDKDHLIQAANQNWPNLNK